MDSTSPRDKHRPTPRVAQACQRCRSLKARCLPSSQDGVCQRCNKSQRACVWTDEQHKIRRTRGPSRIAQVEKKIDGLVARITERKDAPEYPSPADTFTDETRTPVDAPQRRSIGDRNATTSPHDEHPDESEEDPEPPAVSLPKLASMHDFGSSPGAEQSVPKHGKTQDDRLRQSLARADAESFLEEYRTMAPSFPFVPISADTSVEELRSKKPMLLLAIMTAASWKQNRLRDALEKRFREEVAMRTIVRPSTDLVLLQSILIFLAWYHFSMSTKPGALPQVCINLVLELSLDPALKAHMLGDGNSASKSGQELREEQRALLGCYYICSQIATGYQRPNLFKHTRYMHESAAELAEDAEFETDRSIPSLIGAQQLGDDIYDHFNSGLAHTDEYLASQVYNWESRLSDIRRNAITIGISPLIDITLHYVDMNLRLVLAQTTGIVDPISNLNSLLDDCKSFLDGLLSIPTEAFHLMSFSIWITLPHVIMTLSTVCIPSTTHPPMWDAKAAQDRARLDLYVESLCFRMQSRTLYRPPQNPQLDYWIMLKTVLVSVGRWYKKTIESAGERSVPFRCPGRFFGKRVDKGSHKGVPVSCPYSGSTEAGTGMDTGFEDMSLFSDMGGWNDLDDFTGLMDAELGF